MAFRTWQKFDCSAITDTGLETAIKWMVKHLEEKDFPSTPIDFVNSINPFHSGATKPKSPYF